MQSDSSEATLASETLRTGLSRFTLGKRVDVRVPGADTADANKRQSNKLNLTCLRIRINHISKYISCTACTPLGNNFEIQCHGRNVRSQKTEIRRYGFAL